MQKFDGIIFDIDGTIADTNRLIFDSFNYITKKYINKDYKDEEIVEYFGPPEDVIIKELMGEEFLNAQKDYYDFYDENHNELADIHEGMREIVIDLQNKGLPLGIFTGKGQRTTQITLEKIGILDLFDHIVTGDDVDEHKPSPAGIKLFLDKYGLKPERVLMIGDSTGDVKASRGAGVKIASVLWDSYAKDQVLALNSDYYFHTVQELADFLKENT